jgi:hypothetical protein
MLTVIAVGSDKIQDKDGILTQVIVRSSAGVPLKGAELPPVVDKKR